MLQKDPRLNALIVGSLGFTLVTAVALGFAAGYFIDRWLDTRPWFTLIMLAVGLAGGILALYREINNIRKQ